MTQHPTRLRIILLLFIVGLSLASLACETYVGVGVGYGYGYPGGYWGGPWSGGYVGRPVIY